MVVLLWLRLEIGPCDTRSHGRHTSFHYMQLAAGRRLDLVPATDGLIPELKTRLTRQRCHFTARHQGGSDVPSLPRANGTTLSSVFWWDVVVSANLCTDALQQASVGVATVAVCHAPVGLLPTRGVEYRAITGALQHVG